MTLQEVSNFINFIRGESLSLLRAGEETITFRYSEAHGYATYGDPVQSLTVKKIGRSNRIAFVTGPTGKIYAVFLIFSSYDFWVTHVAFSENVRHYRMALFGRDFREIPERSFQIAVLDG